MLLPCLLAPLSTVTCARPLTFPSLPFPPHYNSFQVGDAGYINDSMALHNVGCCMPALAAGEEGPEGGVTLHCYAPPIRRVKIYEDSKVTERVPGYYSKGGVRV